MKWHLVIGDCIIWNVMRTAVNDASVAVCAPPLVLPTPSTWSRVKMKKVKGFFKSQKEIKKVRRAIEKKTEKPLVSFDQSKQRVAELSHEKYLD